MQCNNCGHERPRSGNCPHCGAPATSAPSSSHPSSLRGWRDQAQSSGSGRPSRPNWGDDAPPPSRAPSSRPVGSRDSGANWGAADQSYNQRNASYPRRPGDSNGRRGDPSSSYARRDEYDDGYNDRALMPAPGAGGALMPQLDDRALPALPSEEEERALGIRRPAYIPATDTRKGERPSRMRVVSGTASIMLLCVAMLGISGFLVQRNILPGFLGLVGVSHPHDASTVNDAIPTAYAGMKPLVTVVPNNGTPLINAQSYASEIDPANPDQPVIPKNPTDIFQPGHYVIIIGNTNTQTKTGDTLSIRWYFNGVDSTASVQQSKKDCCSYTLPSSKAGRADQVDFKLVYPAAAQGKAELYYNGKLTITLLFLVVDSSQLTTPTPSPAATPTATTATPAPTKHP